MIKLILACDLNGVIGKDNDMPWKRDLPYDLKRFKELTEGHIIVMGRRTFESIGSRPLPNRQNVVLTTSKTIPLLRQENLFFYNYIENLLEDYDKDVKDKDLFIIGGMQVYKQFMPYVQEVYLTEVIYEFEGDTKIDDDFFEILSDDFEIVKAERIHKDEHNKYDMNFVELKRVRGEYK